MERAPAWPDFMANCGVFAMEVAGAATHSRSFLSERYRGASLETWLAETRPRFLDLLHYAPPDGELLPEVVARVDHGDFVRETLLISTAAWSRVPCDLLIPRRPKGGTWPAPGVVAL